MRYTAIIVEDMPEAAQVLLHDLKNHCPDITVIGMAPSVIEAAKILRTQRPDIIFLDISLQDGTGFDLLEILSDLKAHIIFITASDEHAIKAFRFSATDYLLKPVDTTLLLQAIDKVRKTKSPDPQVLDIIRETYKNPNQLPKKISLHTLEKIIIVNIDEILRCESDGNNTWFFIADGRKVYTTKTLKHFEDLLDEHDFIRVHQSHLVNFSYIAEFSKKDGGFLRLKNNHEIPVSTRKRSEIVQRLEDIF
jgi:two-component system, LytTR family, response regulator